MDPITRSIVIPFVIVLIIVVFLLLMKVVAKKDETVSSSVSGNTDQPLSKWIFGLSLSKQLLRL